MAPPRPARSTVALAAVSVLLAGFLAACTGGETERDPETAGVALVKESPVTTILTEPKPICEQGYAPPTGSLVAYDENDGQVAWTQSIGWSNEKPVPVMAETVVVAASNTDNDGETRLDAVRARDGRAVWNTTLPIRARLEPGAVDRAILVFDETPGAGGLTAMEAATGDVRWRFRTTPEARALVHAGPLVIVDEGDAVFAANLRTGDTEWRAALDDIGLGAVDDAVIVANRVVLASPDGAIAMLDAADGELEVDASRLYDGDRVITGTDLENARGLVIVNFQGTGRLLAVDAELGETRWAFEGADVSQVLAVDRDKLLAFSDNILRVHRRETGEVAWPRLEQAGFRPDRYPDTAFSLPIDDRLALRGDTLFVPQAGPSGGRLLPVNLGTGETPWIVDVAAEAAVVTGANVVATTPSSIVATETQEQYGSEGLAQVWANELDAELASIPLASDKTIVVQTSPRFDPTTGCRPASEDILSGTENLVTGTPSAPLDAQ